MKQYKVKPSSASVTSVDYEGSRYHFFHSEVLGKCRAILIAEDENLSRTEKNHRQQRDEIFNELEQELESRKPLDSAPERCFYCQSDRIRIQDISPYPPAYFCSRCGSWQWWA